MVTHKELAQIIGVESKTTITEILGRRQNIQPDQWKKFRDYFKLSTEYSVPNDILPDLIVQDKKTVYLIELKTASGKEIKVKPEGQSEITLLNAFLEERDRVINTKQERIEELLNDKEKLYNLLNSSLGDITKVQQAIFAMVRTLQEHEAVMTSGGNKKREVEMLETLSRLNGRNLNRDAKVDNAVVLHK